MNDSTIDRPLRGRTRPTNPPAWTTAAALASAAACVTFGIAALRDPEGVGARCGLSVDATRVMGVRDLVVGCLIAVRPSPGILCARAGLDVGDTILLATRRPAIASAAAAFGLANAALAAARRSGASG